MTSQRDYFDPHAYYRFHNRNRPNRTLSIVSDTSDEVDMVPALVTSASENWQIYYQQGRWFIRPYAKPSDKSRYTDYQLGLSEDDEGNVRSVPSVSRRSGELGQQWTFTQVDDGEGGYGYRISNGLKGNNSWLSLTGDIGAPGMQSSQEGSLWDMQINPSALEPENARSYQDVRDFQVASISSSSSISSATPTPTSTPKPSGSPTEPPAIPAPKTSSNALSKGAIIGISVAGIFVLLALAGACFFFMRRRKNRQKLAPVEVSADSKVTYAYEIDSPAVVHMAQERGFQEPRFEMSNDIEPYSSMPTPTPTPTEQRPRGLL